MAGGARNGGGRAFQLTALVAAALFSSFSMMIFNGSLPVYLRDRGGFSVESIGVLVGISFIPQVLAPLFAGPLIDRRGSRLAMRTGATLLVLSALLFMVTGTAAGIGVARLVQGVAYTLLMPASYALLPQLVPTRRLGTATGAFGAIPNLSLAVGPPVGLGLLQLSPQALFVGAAASASLALLATFPLRSSPRPEERAPLLSLDRRWVPLLAVTFLTVVYWGVVTAYLPLHVPAKLVNAVGWFFTADALGVLAIRVPAGYLTDRHGPRWLMVSGIVLTAAAILLLLPPPTLLLLILAGIGTGAGAALLLPPILMELSARSDTHNRGTAMTLFTSSFATAIMVGSLAGGPLVGHLGFNAALLVSAATCCAALPVALLPGSRQEIAGARRGEGGRKIERAE